MLLVESSLEHITDILKSDRPIALVATGDREQVQEVAIAGRDHRLGVSVIQGRSGRLLVMVVADPRQAGELRRFARQYGAEITDRHVDVEKVYVPASWLTGLAKSHGADVGVHL